MLLNTRKSQENMKRWKSVLLSERSHRKRAIYCKSLTTGQSRRGKTMERVKRSEAVGSQVGRKDEPTKHRGFLEQ